ncbi:hypothetical protein [Paractinoplanes hotanensis]|uniref:Uncharacterized protein n=1 Tax=Paractinoplanes hotanensis TaxID=2906497 RepID=A0ABT0Y869_9ACTN|nr:hypothetical protein [Actinoplanes hotanensis]MCM4081647.1 hypothetical protein [Actinoplanes hotanensis]
MVRRRGLRRARLRGHVQQRTPNDGRELRVAKRLWQPADLAAAVARSAGA